MVCKFVGTKMCHDLFIHSMAIANLNKSEDFVTNMYHCSIKLSTYLGGPELASIEIPPFRPHFIKFQKKFFLDEQPFFSGTKKNFPRNNLYSVF